MIIVNDLCFKKFPGGELHLADEKWLNTATDFIAVRLNSSDDIMKLLLFTDAYRRVHNNNPNLYIPYMPYARQDRVANTGESLSIKVVANLINSLGYNKVYTLDPHSDVTKALIDNIVPIEQSTIWGTYLNALLNTSKTLKEDDYKLDEVDLISPDAGALKKIYSVQKAAPKMVKTIRIGTKHRDTKTGQITHTSIDGKPVAKTAVIIDDICDGGRTFIELAKIIRKDYGKIILCVTHGIFSNGLETLFKDIDTIVTVDSWNIEIKSSNRLEVFNIETMLALQHGLKKPINIPF